MFAPIRTRRTFEAAVEQIVEAVRVGDLRVGDRLPPERILAGHMMISRPTLREAIRVLAEAGVVEVRTGPRGGSFVRSDVIPTELLAEQYELRASEVTGVLEARRVLEPRVAQLAALRATEDELEAMQRTIDLQREAWNDRVRFLRLDLRFHETMARATGNPTLAALMRLLLRNLEVARDMAIRMPHDADWALAIHERTLAAIRGRDPEQIESAMDEHLGYLELMWSEAAGDHRPGRPHATLAELDGRRVSPRPAAAAASGRRSRGSAR